MNITGTIPSELASLTDLTLLVLHSNTLSGTLPLWVAEFPLLAQLDLSANRLTGTIPGQYLSVAQLDLDDNLLTGPVPSGEGLASRELAVSFLDLRYNMLSGSIPEEIQSFARLEWLFLDQNLVSGRLPKIILGQDLLF